MDKKTEVPAENRVNKGWRLTRLAGDSAALAFGSLRGAPEAHRWALVPQLRRNAVNLLNRFRQWLPTQRKSVLVPEGYRIVFVKPSPDPAFDRTESGFWIANLGSQAYIEPGFKIVENIIHDDPQCSVIWILQTSLLDYWAADTSRIAELLRRFHRVQRFRVAQGRAGQERVSYWPSGPLRISELLGPQPPVQQSRVADVAVVAEAGSNARALMALFSSMGVPTHLSIAEKEIFIEIHRPDKIIVGIPGSRMEVSTEQTLHQLNGERDQLETSSEAGAKLLEIEKRELAYIEQILRTTTRPVSNYLRIGVKRGDPLLSDLIAEYALSRGPKVYTRFIESFLRAQVGVQTSGGTEKTRNQATSTNETPIGFHKTASGDGRERILAFADPPVYAMRFGEGFNSLVSGEEILKAVTAIPECGGVYVNSALSEVGLLINRETALSVLKSSVTARQ